MKTLIDLKDEIHNYWDFEDDKERDRIDKDIRAYLKSVDESTSIVEIRANFPQDKSSGISVIYDIISELGDNNKWTSFFQEEIKRAFHTAEKSTDAFQTLDCLEEILFEDDLDPTIEKEMVHFLASYLSHSKDELRYKSVWLLGDWLGKENVDQYPQVVLKIKEKLKDKNWKIRTITKGILEDMGKLPDGYKIPFMDKMKAKLSSPYEMT